jgi:hypothetical protein
MRGVWPRHAPRGCCATCRGAARPHGRAGGPHAVAPPHAGAPPRAHQQLLDLAPKLDRHVVREDVLKRHALLVVVVVPHREVALGAADDDGRPERAAEAGARLVGGRRPPHAHLRRGQAGGERARGSGARRRGPGTRPRAPPPAPGRRRGPAGPRRAPRGAGGRAAAAASARRGARRRGPDEAGRRRPPRAPGAPRPPRPPATALEALPAPPGRPGARGADHSGRGQVRGTRDRAFGALTRSRTPPRERFTVSSSIPSPSSSSCAVLRRDERRSRPDAMPHGVWGRGAMPGVQGSRGRRRAGGGTPGGRGRRAGRAIARGRKRGGGGAEGGRENDAREAPPRGAWRRRSAGAGAACPVTHAVPPGRGRRPVKPVDHAAHPRRAAHPRSPRRGRGGRSGFCLLTGCRRRGRHTTKKGSTLRSRYSTSRAGSGPSAANHCGR